MIFVIAQAIGFQALWFSAILGKNQWLLLGLVLIVLNLFSSPQRRSDIKLIPLALVGLVGDAILTYVGLFQFDHTPLWLVLIWLGFVFTFNHSMAWLQRIDWPLQAAIGGVAGTLSYLAGERLGAVALPMGTLMSTAVLAIYWAFLLPSFMKMSLYLTKQ